MNKAIVIFSGGQDSTTCLYWAREKFSEIEAITFYYGQKHKIELEAAENICRKEGIKQTVIDISFLQTISDSAMVHGRDTSQIKNGLPTSFVPNRNALFITLAHAYAQKVGSEHLVTGVCQTDYSGYPDCRLQFITAMQFALNTGSSALITIHTPLMYLNKAETFALAQELGVLPEIVTLTHTCYEGNQDPNVWGNGCGVCPACELRKKGYRGFLNLGGKDLS